MRISNCNRLLRTVLFTTLLAGWAAQSAFSQEAADKQLVNLGDTAIGALDELIILESEVEGRISIKATIRLNDFAARLDEILVEKGDLQAGCSRDLHWRNGTRIRDSGPSEKLYLNSKFRYEQWLCGLIKTRLFSVSSNFDWNLSIQPSSLASLQLSAQVTNVRGVQNDLEDLLDLRTRDTVRIPIRGICGRCDCAELSEELKVEIDSVVFEAAESDTVLARFSLLTSGDLDPLLQCID